MNKQTPMATTLVYAFLFVLVVQDAPVAQAVRVLVLVVRVALDALDVRAAPVALDVVDVADVLDVVAVLADAEAVVAALVDFLIYQSFCFIPCRKFLQGSFLWSDI
ncbi:hypothetical protein Q7A53_11485 [Halobacillus rhizosphaerae]|uniref:hypothetical protein n=1 Tax=Halobacillus rhizosphaerae TaxID=3064889 RepID=UPI00398A560D